MECKICKKSMNKFGKAVILNKYNIDYYKCNYCDFICTEEPYWLEEAYQESINITDTGIMSRNLYLSKMTTIIIEFLFDSNKMFLDFAGGYGIFTRLMRDIGFDFYWHDPYSKNLLAREFEIDKAKASEIELLTSFETFEHFSYPLIEFEKMLHYSKNILFTTELVPNKEEFSKDWWYFGFEHGQHISFYSVRTLKYMAKKYHLNFYSNQKDLHLFTTKKINPFIFKIIIKMNRFGFFNLIKKSKKSKTVSDMHLIIKRMEIK